MPSRLERAAALTTSTRLCCDDERADRVDDGLGAAGAGQRLDDERVAGRDLRDDVLLLGVGVEQQGVGRGAALVLRRSPSTGRYASCDLARSRDGVAGERVEHRGARARGRRARISVATSAKVDTTSRGCTLNQGRCEVRPRRRSMTGLRLERRRCVRGERDERVGVERDLELLVQRAGELRVEERLRP